MSPSWITDRLSTNPEKEAVVLGEQRVSYRDLLDLISARTDQLTVAGVESGAVVTVEGDHSPDTYATLLALLEMNVLAVPVSPIESRRMEQLLDIARVEFRVDHAGANVRITHIKSVPFDDRLLRELHARGTGGLILFTSGYTAAPKASLHAADRFLGKYQRPTKAYRALALPPFDHLAGLDTLFYALANGGTLICPERREPESIAELVEKHQIELFPSSPTFLNLMLASDVFSTFDLASLRLIAYGSEVMPETTLSRLRAALPDCQFVQKYGMTELGSPRTRNESDGSLWVKIEGEGVEHRVVDGVLWVRSEGAMLDYLNAPNPFDEDGWFCTDDLVEVKGDYLRFLGRVTDVINVGGHKVNPSEVEGVILGMDNIRAATVYAEPNALTGQTVAVHVTLSSPEDGGELARRIRRHCRSRLARYQVPVRVEIGEQRLSASGHKSVRTGGTFDSESGSPADSHTNRLAHG